MEYPKKISCFYDKGQRPDIIIRGSGELPSVKIAEYRLVKEKGNLCVYKRI